MSMTRDAYAKEVLKVAQAALEGNETVLCPHQNCDEPLRIVRQSVFSTRSILCPVHGHIFQEQRADPFTKLDWTKAKKLAEERLSEFQEEYAEDSD